MPLTTKAGSASGDGGWRRSGRILGWLVCCGRGRRGSAQTGHEKPDRCPGPTPAATSAMTYRPAGEPSAVARTAERQPAGEKKQSASAEVMGQLVRGRTPYRMILRQG